LTGNARKDQFMHLFSGYDYNYSGHMTDSESLIRMPLMLPVSQNKVSPEVDSLLG